MTDPSHPQDATLTPARPAASGLRLPGIGAAPPFRPHIAAALASPSDVGLTDCTPGAEADGGPLLDSALSSAYPDAPPSVAGAAAELELSTPSPSLDLEHQRPLLPFTIAGALQLATQQTSMAAGLAARQGLRLPSFEALGIAAPHPDRAATMSPSESSLLVGAGPLSRPGDPLHQLSPGATRKSPALSPSCLEHPPLPRTDTSQRSITHFISTLTPPDDASRTRWPGQYPNVTSAAMGSPAQSDPERPTPDSRHASDAGTTASPQQTRPAPAALEPSAVGVGGDWVDPALQTLLGSVNFSKPSGNALKVLSHALPSPSGSGFVFPLVINRLLERMAPRPATWINVFHAVPGRFNLSDLPTSPPNTPGTVVEGDDYFTSKTFDTAVPVTDYEGPATALPKSPRPAVPPGSIDVSIVERYIPPPTPNEARHLFDRSSRSLLSDRLVELSTCNGLLLFIYPTKTGARTFMSEYLGPVLEPLIRTMTIVNELPTELGAAIHSMASVEHLVEFGELRASMEHFCRHLSSGNDSLSRFHPDRKAVYELVYADRRDVEPARHTWSADWWAKQERPRIRQTVAKFMTESKRQQDSVMPTAVIQGILDGVVSKSQPNRTPARGIEVGVFVIRKRS